jgi:hypothetical protein
MIMRPRRAHSSRIAGADVRHDDRGPQLLFGDAAHVEHEGRLGQRCLGELVAGFA